MQPSEPASGRQGERAPDGAPDGLPAAAGLEQVGAARRSRRAPGHKTLWSSGFRGGDSSKAMLLRVSRRTRPLPDHLWGRKRSPLRGSGQFRGQAGRTPTPLPLGYLTEEIQLEK